MQINIITNKKDLDVFVSKRAKKKMREYIKQFNYSELRKYWNQLETTDLVKYLKPLVNVNTEFSKKDNSLTLTFEIYESH